MIILAIIGTLAAIAWTLLVFMGNAMSSRPTDGLGGGWTIIAAWIGVLLLYAAWWWG
jgi:hypothetical protein